jgi:hypothetical protein
VLNQKGETMSAVVVLTKQGVRNLNELGPKKKSDEAKRASEAAAVEQTGEIPEKAPAEEKVGQ